jgi:hypothetical protein
MTETIATTAKPKSSTKRVALIICIAIGCVPAAYASVSLGLSILGAFGSSTNASSVNEQMATKAKADYQFALDHGSSMDACVAAGQVVAVYQYNQDAENFKFFKGLEETSCRFASSN